MIAWLNARGVDLLTRFNYEIRNPKGNENLASNIWDAIFFITYFCLSVINLKNSTPTSYVFFLNVITLLRLIIKNFIDQKTIAKKESAKMTLIHVIKIVGEFGLLFTSMLVYEYNIIIANINKSDVDYGLIKIFIILILAASLFENTLVYLERTYDAVPRLMKNI